MFTIFLKEIITLLAIFKLLNNHHYCQSIAIFTSGFLNGKFIDNTSLQISFFSSRDEIIFSHGLWPPKHENDF